MIPKVKFFLWRILTNSLPTKVALVKGTIDIDPVCQRFGEDVETMEHVLRDCRWGKFFWKASMIRLTVNTSTLVTMAQWIEDLCKPQEAEFQAVFTTLLWIIWFARNMLIFQQVKFTHLQCYELAMKHRVHTGDTNSRARLRQAVVMWIRPRLGWWKINVDAAVKEGIGVGLGAIIRDANGQVLGCCFKFRRSTLSVDIAESLAVREGAVLAGSLQGGRIILETDCQMIFNELRNHSPDLSYLSSIVSDILVSCYSFSSFEFSWIRGDANKVAQQLACLALIIKTDGSCIGSLPAGVSLPVLEDTQSSY